MVAPSERDGLEARVHAERAQDVADVIPHGLDAEVELGRDLVRRAAVLEQPKHLGLARRQVRMSRGRALVDLDVHDLPEHRDHLLAVPQRNGADVDEDALSVGVYEDDLVVGTLDNTGDIACEDLPRAASLLR